MAHGLPGETPTIAVASATRPEQKVIAGTIADIADRLQQAALAGPLLVMIGRALADAASAEMGAGEERAGQDEGMDASPPTGRQQAS
jgi:siroheme synthase